MPLLCPSRSEQTAIVSWIENEQSAISSAVLNAKRGIDLLNEYRTLLIADVVTGKLDVREAAARLPDDSAPLDEAAVEPDGEQDEDEVLDTAEEIQG